MSYIGRTPQIGAYSKLDAITTDGSASYTMQLNSANFVPESVNHLIVSVNGVIQAPTDSFTVSGSTITFASSLSASDTIDFIMALGNVLDIGVPSDNTVSLSKLTASGTKDATTFLRGDNTFAVPSGGGKIGQVVQVVKTDTFSTTSTSYVDITGLSLSITPSSTSSKVLINVSGVGGNDSSHTRVSLKLLEDSTNLVEHAVGLGGDSQLAGFAINYLSSPNTTSSLTYKLQLRMDIAGGSGSTINRSFNDSNVKGITTITLTEVLA